MREVEWKYKFKEEKDKNFIKSLFTFLKLDDIGHYITDI